MKCLLICFDIEAAQVIYKIIIIVIVLYPSNVILLWKGSSKCSLINEEYFNMFILLFNVVTCTRHAI